VHWFYDLHGWKFEGGSRTTLQDFIGFFITLVTWLLFKMNASPNSSSQYWVSSLSSSTIFSLFDDHVSTVILRRSSIVCADRELPGTDQLLSNNICCKEGNFFDFFDGVTAKASCDERDIFSSCVLTFVS